MTKTQNKKLYDCWTNMKARCFNPAHNDYPYYGKKGITVCERWLIFENFYRDMGFPPNSCSLDRIDSNGIYEPMNCRWADKNTQNRNRKSNGYTFHKGHGKYHVNIKVNGKKYYFGSYDDPNEAQQVYFKEKTKFEDPRPEVAKRLHKIWEAII